MEPAVADDRISGLPEPILHHILSFLHTEDATKIAPTCKGLNRVWSTLPYLDLGINFFPCSTSIREEGLTTDIVMRRREKLFTFLEQTLSRRKMQGLTVHKFYLKWTTEMDVELWNNLDRWIDYLVHCNIHELDLGGLGIDSEYNRYKLPPVLLTATSLRALSLWGCSMPLASVTLPALQKLILHDISLHEKILLDIINTCPNLEDLELCWWSGLQKRISLAPPRHSRLRNLKLTPSYRKEDGEVNEVVIEAHNLEKFWFEGLGLPITYIITNSEASLKYLELRSVEVTNTWLCELIPRLSCLEELHLYRLNLKIIEISSSSLKLLELTIRFGEFKINTPNLVSLVYAGSISSVFQNSLAIKEVSLILNGYQSLDGFRPGRTNEHLCSDFMQFLQKFDYSEVVTLECPYFELLFFPLEMRLNLHTPLAHIKHLILKGVFRGAPADVLAELFKGVQWIAPNLDSLSFKAFKRETRLEGDRIELIKFTAGQCDCSTSPSECLKKCRSRTKIEVEGVGVEVDALSNYLHRGDGSRGDYCNPWDLQYCSMQ